MERRPQNPNTRETANRGNESGNRDPIEERILDNREESQQSMESAAQDAFDRDQNRSDHPAQIRRDLNEERGVEDPSHSQAI